MNDRFSPRGARRSCQKPRDFERPPAVASGLPAEFAQEIFATLRAYDVIARFSTNPGDILADSVSTPRGLAIKLLTVDGEMLPENAGDTTQEFVMANGRYFLPPMQRSS